MKNLMKALWNLQVFVLLYQWFMKLWWSPNPEIKRQVAPPAATIIERLHLFIGNSDKLKQFVIDGFWWEVKEQMSFMVLLTRLKKLILVCRWCQSRPSILYLSCPNITILQKLNNSAVFPETSMAPPAGVFYDRVNINFLSIRETSYGVLILFLDLDTFIDV